MTRLEHHVRWVRGPGQWQVFIPGYEAKLRETSLLGADGATRCE